MLLLLFGIINMKKILFLVAIFSLAGCASQPARQVTDLRPVKLSQVNIESTTHGYIAASAFYQFIEYDNLGNVATNYVAPNPRHCNMFRPDVKCPETANAFAPVNNPTSAYDLSFEGFSVNTLYFFEVPVGRYIKRSNKRNYSGYVYDGPQFEVKPGQVLYYGHYQDQYDLERNFLMGDHFEFICDGFTNKIDDAKSKLHKIDPNLQFDSSLISTFKMNTPNDGRNPCTIQTIN